MASSPFKFLDAFTLQDKEFFFGREQETEVLYEMAFQSSIMLIYGLSGTGKTSLIQCGLASQFDGPDWYPLWIRRQENINDSLRNAIDQAIGEEEFEFEELVEGVSTLFRYYLRPIYLIFDQFEELFILGMPEEQELFIQSIKQLVKAELPCKIIFVMREEYLGQLYYFEKLIPSIFDFRLRVEPMTNKKVKAVMQSSFDKFNISLEGDQGVGFQGVVDNVSAGKSGIQLPYLQVYLDMLYREVHGKTYQELIPKEKYPPLTFSKNAIQSLGKIEDVLDRFLEEQESNIQLALKSEFSSMEEDTVRKILDSFVTEEGTKRPIYYQQSNQTIEVDQRQRSIFFFQSNEEVLSEAFKALEKRRLIRFSEDTMELAHDSLATLIDQRRSDEQRLLNEIHRRISNAYKEKVVSGVFLNRNQLASIDPYLGKLRLNKKYLAFIEDSRRETERIEKDELKRQREEIEKEKRLRKQAEVAEKEALSAKGIAEKQKRKAESNARSARRRALIAGLAAVSAISAAGIAFQQFHSANIAKKDAIEKGIEAEDAKELLEENVETQKRQNYENFLTQGKLKMEAELYQEAIPLFEAAISWDSTQIEPQALIKNCNKLLNVNSRYTSIMSVADEALKNGNLITAIQQFSSALSLPVGTFRQKQVELKIEECQLKMIPIYKKKIKEASILLKAKNCEYAMLRIKEAKKYEQYLNKDKIQEEWRDLRAIESKCQ